MSTDLRNVEPADSNQSPVQFVVGLGASAGGLKSLERFFKSLPVPTSSAFVVVQHISPDADSSMDEILSRYTTLRVISVEQRMQLKPETVYLIPPGKEIRLASDHFEVAHLDREQIARPIDTFFRSLAESYGERALAVVFSGTGSDGSEGIESVHRLGGSTIAESPQSAQFDGMPKNAIATDCVDMVLTPEEIGLWLGRQFEDPNRRPAPIAALGHEELTGIKLIFSLLAERHEIEFSFYKPATVARRIERRQKISRQKTLLEYAEYVKKNVEELDILYHDLLIGVTKFFRDTDAFAKLERHLNQIVADLPEEQELRVWSAGCATGEEPYSLAMLCHDAFDIAKKPANFKVFATDVHTGSLETASKGIYDRDSTEFVGADRHRKYFIPEGKTFRVSSSLRQHMVFARHNVVQDPAFTRMDLVTCRNLLIYLRPEAQSQAIASFHFALKCGGLMMMGPSESPAELSDEFEVVDETWKIYSKLRDLKTSKKPGGDPLQRKVNTRPRRLVNLLNNDKPQALSFTSLLEGYDLILRQYIESGILLDEKRNILHVFGNAHRYLKSGSGRFTGSLMGFLQGDTKVAIASALIRAFKSMGRQVVLEDLAIPVGDGIEQTDVHVRALGESSSNSFAWFVSFVKATKEAKADKASSSEEEDPIVVNLASDAYAAMESELTYTKESLSATIEELETSNEELQAANEQLLAANEELQSTNQELHSVNEELYSVNAENHRKIEALEEMTDDVDNLLASTDIGTIFLDSELEIRRFTQAAVNYIKMQPSDIGRNITDFATHLNTVDFYDKISEVMSSAVSISETLSTRAGGQVLVRIMPYLSNNKVKGAIVNFIDITDASKGKEDT